MNDPFRATLEQLQSAPESLPWPDRVKLCRTLKDVLASGTDAPSALAIVKQLAHDPKWEVRQAIAKLLDLVAEDEFAPLAARLAKDRNDLVRLDARKAVDRRRRLAREASKNQFVADDIQQQFDWMEASFGKAVARKARRLCERYNELVVAAIVHDLRNIMTSLKTQYFILAEGVNGSVVERRAAKKYDKAFGFLERTLDDMETFTRSSPKDRSVEEVRALIDDAVDLAVTSVRKNGLAPDPVKVQVQMKEPLRVFVSRRMIVLALSHVIKNAVEAFATGSGELRAGRIRIRAGKADGMAEIIVQDNGMGVSKEEKVMLFVPGRRNKSKKQSTGYGLATARKYLLAHDGSFSLQSEEDSGTVVTLTIPLAPERSVER